MGSMGGGGQSALPDVTPWTPACRRRPPRAPDLLEHWRQPGAAVPLGELADVRVVTGPPMIKDENGVLVGCVFADIDQTQRDLGGWVDDAKAVVAAQLTLPAGTLLVLPAAYATWRRHHVFAALSVSMPQEVAPHPGGAV